MALTKNQKEAVKEVIWYLENEKSDLEYGIDRVYGERPDAVEDLKNIKSWLPKLKEIVE